MPMDAMTYVDGPEQHLSYDELLAEARGLSDYWYLVRVYRNYAGGLDAHYRFADDDNIYVYTLDMPAIVQDDAGDTIMNANYDNPYPAPFQWYLSTGKTWVATYTASEYAMLGSYDADDCP